MTRLTIFFGLFGIIGCLLFCAAPVHAQEAGGAKQEATREKLDALSDEINDRKARQKRLRAEAEKLQAQQRALRHRVIGLARDLQNIDAERDRLEERLAELAVSENQLDENLQKDRAALSRLLAGLQAMQKQPAPAFAVHADDALAAVQGALVMSAVVPGMQVRADKLRDQLTELAAIRRRMDRQSEALIIAERDAGDARAGLDIALAEKATAENQARRAAAQETLAIKKLVAEARDLRDLARRLGQRAPALIGEATFAKARGLVPLPVSGHITERFGQRNENKVVQKGITIMARPGAQITAPYDGRVLYSGPFRQYGDIVILGIAGGFQMILAGLDEAQSFVGQNLLAGEPVGRMQDSQGQLGAGSSGRSQLYMELRHNGDPIDPAPWLKQAG